MTSFMVQKVETARNDSTVASTELLTPVCAPICVSVNAPTVMWLRLNVPFEAEAGIYYGEAILCDEEGHKGRFPLALRIYDAQVDLNSVPAGVEIWQSWDELSRRAGLSMFSEPWWESITERLEYSAEVGNRTVQVGRAYFDWIRTDEGQWQFDFSRFERYMRTCSEFWPCADIAYVGMVNCTGEDAIFYSGDNGALERVIAGPGDPLYDDGWSAFLRALSSRDAAARSRLTVWVADRPNSSQIEHVSRAVAVVRQAAPAAHAGVTFDDVGVFSALLGSIDIAAVPLSQYADFAAVVEAQDGTHNIKLLAYPDVGDGSSWLASTADHDLWSFAAGYTSQFAPLQGLLVTTYPTVTGLQRSLQSERLMLGIEAAQLVRQAGFSNSVLDGTQVLDSARDAQRERLRALKNIELGGVLQ